MRKILIFILFAFFLLPVRSALAVEDPTAVPNNKFGIHITDENDLSRAAELVNSSGGDWGYVTFVIREDERVKDRWQEVFNKMRRLHLIPIVRIATTQGKEGWNKPGETEIENWVNFLNSLNWVVKNRYVVIGNEPNQAHEWGGVIKPVEYGEYLKQFSRKLKGASGDFYVITAGFDAAAPNSKSTMSEEKYLKDMLSAVPDVFDYVDGWSSHSYAKPGVSFENQFGQGTLRTFQWELTYLRSLGVSRQFPVFITETGWTHDAGEGDIAKDVAAALETVWDDERVVAVTPFVLNYPSPLFERFSWIRADGTPYNFFNSTKEVPKTTGNPIQITDGLILGNLNLPIVQAGHGIYGVLVAQNNGQSIWDETNLSVYGGSLTTSSAVEPGNRKILFFRLNAPGMSGLYSSDLQLTYNGVKFGNEKKLSVRVIKLPQILNFLP